MPIDHNFRQFAEQFQNKPQEFNEDVIIPLARFTDRRWGSIATNKYMQDAGATFTVDKPPRPRNLAGPLRKVSGRLERAVLGSFSDITGRGGTRESETFISPRLEGLVWRKIITVPYAAIHEYGGSFRVRTSGDMVRYFWAKAYETSQGSVISEFNEWKRLALAAKKRSFFEITIPARPYARPALEDVTPEVIEKGEELIQDWLSS